jgi:acyl transferase domain-containing protein
MPVEVAPDGREWSRSERRRLAGVSSFGFSGTNAHVIVEEAPVSPTAAVGPDRPLHCLPVSARTSEALLAIAADTADVLATSSLADVAHTAGVGRAHSIERLAVVASDRDEARAALAAAATGATHSSLHRGTAVPGTAPEVVFLFTGQGAQYPGMGAHLYQTSPVFRAAIDQCDAVMGGALGPVLHGKDTAIHDTAITQPALFAVEYALTQLWRSWGVEPAAVIGHSLGEYTAACVAGVFTVEDCLRLIVERGRLLGALPTGGTMAAVFAPVDEVAAAVAPLADQLAIAAINAADSATSWATSS